jgi:hypothetical protein
VIMLAASVLLACGCDAQQPRWKGTLETVSPTGATEMKITSTAFRNNARIGVKYTLTLQKIHAASASKICTTLSLRFLPAQNVRTSLPDWLDIRPAR